jgi:hypothetical protein|uniref:DUF2577 domain-containing protein n=1 Tax=Siphoviridae sp. ctQ0C17 TaxID=2826325 RepID=A0A8S5NDE3_9CAUD|nr:DUF2577 domain-containing protein [uncultured Lachnoclostridium sp.]DAD92248.1 MAG TPA: Protein of unknown function (DUF2577) [Siphoviridae sp. ctQ0C17]
MGDLIQIIKQAAYEAIEASKPVCFLYGIVTETKPFTIQIDQKLILTSDFLLLPEYLTNREVILKSSNGLKSTFLLENGLKKGEHVILLQQKGGQRFLVLDRMVMS